MTTLVPSGLVTDETSSPQQDLTATLTAIKAQILALQTSTLIKPEAFGAVANSQAAAAANRTALQNWLNAGDTGVLWHNPNNVYFVNTDTTPLFIRKRSTIVWLRLRPIIQAGGNQKLLSFSPTFGTALNLTSQAITRGQSTLTLALGVAAPAVGTKLLVLAGQDAYSATETGWQQVATVTATGTSGANNTVTLDVQAPRGFAATSTATGQLLPITSGAGEGSLISYLDIDEAGQTNALGSTLEFSATSDVRVRRYDHNAARAETIRFNRAAESCLVENYYNRLPLTRLGGAVTFNHDFNNRVKLMKTETKTEHTAFVQSGYSVGASCERLDLHKYGLTAWTNGLLVATQEATPMQVGLVNAIDDLDASSAGAGLRLASQSQNGAPPNVRVFLFDKDPHTLGCLPGYVGTKSVEGKLTPIHREYTFPSTTGVFTQDYFVARMWFPRVDVFAPDFNNFNVNLFAPPYNAAGASRSSLKYNYEAAESAGNEAPVNVWNPWLTESSGQNYSLANGQAFNDGTNIERWLRFSTTAAVSGKYVRLKLHGYPMKTTFTNTNT